MIIDTNWQTVEENTKESFRLCKNDIINFGVQLAKVQQAQRALAEEVGELKNRPTVVNGRVDLSSVYSRIDALNMELVALRDHRHSEFETELKDLRKRYEGLVGVTKELITALEVKAKIPPQVVRVMQKPKIIKVTKQAKHTYVASKATMRVHDPHCPFARNVKRKNKIVFKTRMRAFKKGYRACKCLK